MTVKKSGQLYRCPHFLVIIRKKIEGPTRLGVTVTKKIGGAVVRNRIKRYLREFFRVEYQSLPPATDFSIIGLRGAEKLSFSDVQRELQVVLLSVKGSTDR
jgi:ribonuclease P protein component